MPKLKIDIFCDVIDNYGDAGVCLNLARSLIEDQSCSVRIFCNDLDVMNHLLNESDNKNSYLEIVNWDLNRTAYDPADVVIPAFNCFFDDTTLSKLQELSRNERAAMNAAQTNGPESLALNGDSNDGSKAPVVPRAPLMINLDYLSAEQWTEDYHGVFSPIHDILVYYFYPGFTPTSGGLNIDRAFKEKALQHLVSLAVKAKNLASSDATSTQANMLDKLLSCDDKSDLSFSVFSYQNLVLPKLFQKSARTKHFTLNVFEGIPLNNLNTIFKTKLAVPNELYFKDGLAFSKGDALENSLNATKEAKDDVKTGTLGTALSEEGDSKQSKALGNVCLKATAMVPHAKYDELLLSSDFNLVRGEDSIVRALHVGSPFLWQIYVQKQNQHLIKLSAFINRVKVIMSQSIPELITKLSSIDIMSDDAASKLKDLSLSDVCLKALKDSGLQITDLFVIKNSSDLNQALNAFEEVLLAYNGGKELDLNFDLEEFVAKTAFIYHNLAVYLNLQDSLSDRLLIFIKKKRPDLF